MLISLAEYAKNVNRDHSVIRRYAEQGRFTTAQKVGRNWIIDSEEEYPIANKAGAKKCDSINKKGKEEKLCR